MVDNAIIICLWREMKFDLVMFARRQVARVTMSISTQWVLFFAKGYSQISVKNRTIASKASFFVTMGDKKNEYCRIAKGQ